jgi:hypothetical protein
VTLAGCPRPSSDPASAAAATPASAVAERGRKLAEAVDRIFADIYSASEATRSGADEAPSAQVERALAPYEKLAARYGFQPLEPPEGGRSYLREKYLLIVLYSGRWGISDRTLDPDRGGKLIAAGIASNSLDDWLQRNMK